MQKEFPVICFVPADEPAFEAGQATLQAFDRIPSPPVEGFIKTLQPSEVQNWDRGQAWLGLIGLNLDRSVVTRGSADQKPAEAAQEVKAVATPVSQTASREAPVAAVASPHLSSPCHPAAC